LTYRQPVLQTPSHELALGLTFSREDSKTSLLGIPFPLSPGAEDDGETHISALRFFQEWVNRKEREVIALRSQFNLGVDWFNATVNDGDIPDSNFFSWQGQSQYLRILRPDTLLLLRANVQLAADPLLVQEQFGIGGLGSVRGYRQDLLLTDNAIFASAELRFPIARISRWDSVIQLVPFFDYGIGWNQGDDPDPDPNNLASVGVGLLWYADNRFNARLDYGIPLIDADDSGGSFQEDGFLFSITVNLF
jgi:hemolysin activation/secretion protein